MSRSTPDTASNRLLDRLPAAERERFVAGCKPVELELGSVLYEQGARIRYAYFPLNSFVSMLTSVDRNSTLEVGMIGSEGMCGYTLLLGGKQAPLRALVQGAGSALRMEAAAFQRHVQSSPALHRILHSYVYVLLRQLAQTVACTRFHVVEKRLARWLLMTHDRAHSDSFAMTQAFLAHMLGVRRVGVTKAASFLQSRKLIRYSRGQIEVLDRRRLEAAACACYRTDQAVYREGQGLASRRA